MNSLEELTQAIATCRNSWDCLQECYDALIAESIIRHYVGHGSVKDALDTYKIRAFTTQRAGLPTCGFERTLDNLALRAPDEILRADSLVSADKVFVLFSLESIGEVIGCIRVMGDTEIWKELD